jgi:hypothetical protein
MLAAWPTGDTSPGPCQAVRIPNCSQKIANLRAAVIPPICKDHRVYRTQALVGIVEQFDIVPYPVTDILKEFYCVPQVKFWIVVDSLWRGIGPVKIFGIFCGIKRKKSTSATGCSVSFARGSSLGNF